MYYNVSFQYSETVYCSNIADAANENDVAAHYGKKYKWYSISPASENDVNDARRRGKPIIKCGPAPAPSDKDADSKPAADAAPAESMKGSDNDSTTAAAPAAPAADPVAEWYSKDPETQWQEILSAARAACVLRQDLARRAGRPAPEEIAGAAWIRLTEALTRPRGRRLDQLQLYAALTALTAAARENTHSIGGTRIDDTGGTIPEAAAPGADRRPTENADPVADLFPPGDPLGLYCRLLYAGYSPEEIADFTGDSRRRVYYLRDMIRDRITAARGR